MSQSTAEFILMGFGIYVLIGLIYSVYFFKVQAPKSDPLFAQAKFSVKLLMLPAAIMLWPLTSVFGEKKHD